MNDRNYRTDTHPEKEISYLAMALALAAKHIPVFPCEDKDTPLTPNGVRDATTDPRLINAWWMKHPEAWVAVPTGPKEFGGSGYDVLNLCGHGLADFPDWRNMSPLVALTPHPNGSHVFYNSEGKAIGLTLLPHNNDIRSRGEYVIVYPSPGYFFEKGDLRDCPEAPSLPNDILAAGFAFNFAKGHAIRLCAIVPDGAIETRTFTPSEVAAAREWIARHNTTRNIYFHVNVAGQLAPDQKAKKNDITEILAAHADLDPPPDRILDADRWRRQTIAKAQACEPRPSIIVASGNGLNLYWLFKEPILADPAMKERVEGCSRTLAAAFAGDACFNIDRIMRVPFTANFPTKKKLAKGYSADPVPASIVEADWTRRYALGDMPASPRPEETAHDGGGVSGVNTGDHDPRLARLPDRSNTLSKSGMIRLSPTSLRAGRKQSGR